ICDKYSVAARRVLELWRPGGMTDWQRKKLADHSRADSPWGPVDPLLGPKPGHIGLPEINRLWQDRKAAFREWFDGIEPAPDFDEMGCPFLSVEKFHNWRANYCNYLDLSYSEFKEAGLRNWRADIYFDMFVYMTLLLLSGLYPIHSKEAAGGRVPSFMN